MGPAAHPGCISYRKRLLLDILQDPGTLYKWPEKVPHGLEEMEMNILNRISYAGVWIVYQLVKARADVHSILPAGSLEPMARIAEPYNKPISEYFRLLQAVV